MNRGGSEGNRGGLNYKGPRKFGRDKGFSRGNRRGGGNPRRGGVGARGGQKTIIEPHPNFPGLLIKEFLLCDQKMRMP